MAKTTRTLNPLPFQDLEPHRFEDLVRQLAYDFRTWRLLEPTGRLGTDDGYDARGFEIVGDQESESEDDEQEEKDSAKKTSPDRLWQIQCKREKTITPAKLEKYLEEMIPKGADVPYGVLFAAPCEFSKQTRDLFREKLSQKGVQEFYLWGRADLEDMLVLPKNDHLLFAYFGISLIIRRRTIKSEISARLAMKRKTVKYLGAIGQKSYTTVLVRDINAESYPYIKMGEKIEDFRKKPRWKQYQFVGHDHNGIRLLTRKYHAYKEVDPQTGELLKWDYSNEYNMALIHDDYWNNPKDETDVHYRGYMFSQKIDKANRAYFETEAVIPYERIIEIDNLGDPLAQCPHIFVDIRSAKNGSWFEYGESFLRPDDNWGSSHTIYDKHEKLRIKHFPKKFPKVKREPLPPMGTKKKEDEVNPEPKKDS
ncbi:MAG: hypothetical protein WC908_00565 [Candidatus Paceibacterota bacterium]